MLANTAWLVAGKGFGAVLSLGYLAILTRVLGVEGFGQFALITGLAQAIVVLAGFQTWQVVVRYGAEHIHSDRSDAAFGRLAMLCAGFDLAGAMIGCVIAYVAIYLLGAQFGWTGRLADVTFVFTCVMLFALVSTPTGIVRAIDRFDLAIYVEALVPIGRIAVASIVALTDPDIVNFLIGWAAVDIVEAVAYWGLARRLLPDAIRWRHLREAGGAFRDNPGIGRFLLITSASSSLNAAIKQGPLLAVGALAGPAAAGLYRLAAQIGNGLTKLSSLLSRTVYTEVNRTRVTAAAEHLRALVWRTSGGAVAIGVVVVIVAVALGQPAIELLSGSTFLGAYPILVWLSAAAAIELASVAFEPVLLSGDTPRRALIVRAVAVVALVVAMIVLVPLYAALGAAIAVLVAAVVSFVMMGAQAYRQLSAPPDRPE